MEAYRYVLLGAGIAGGKASEGIRKVDAEGSLAIVGAESHRPYQRPPLSKGYLRGEEGEDEVFLQPADYYDAQRITLLTDVTATGIRRDEHELLLSDGRVLRYEKLLLATGGRPRRLPVPGAELPGAHLLRRIEDSQHIRQAAQGGGRAVAIGGSFIASEVAASLSQMGVQVEMVFPESRILERVLTPEISAHIQSRFRDKGVLLHTGATAARIEAAGDDLRVSLSNGETVEAGLVIIGIGIELNTEIARNAGLDLDRQGALLVDEYLRTSDPDVFAAGDIAAWPDPTFGRRMRVEHWDVARRQGLRAGGNMAGDLKAYTALPYFFSDMFDISFEAWGDLSEWDATLTRGRLEENSFAVYYFRQGTLCGVVAAGRPDDERKPMSALIKAHLDYETATAKLSDETIRLDTLLQH